MNVFVFPTHVWIQFRPHTLNKHKIVLQKWILKHRETKIILQDGQIAQIVGATSILNDTQFAHKLSW